MKQHSIPVAVASAVHMIATFGMLVVILSALSLFKIGRANDDTRTVIIAVTVLVCVPEMVSVIYAFHDISKKTNVYWFVRTSLYPIFSCLTLLWLHFSVLDVPDLFKGLLGTLIGFVLFSYAKQLWDERIYPIKSETETHKEK
ncbi:hypothetical protein PT282_04655 [Bifidobacterium sp. ESL0763]|uniref:hypothetical protein n=1 Tax=Bifidobacterium sp. ESL0763 TaxID=2983227 RepID=UPI0023F966ED|nr:hypothetical protein [Bifidobacterium sp. ESL0763]MDF7663954.1 hypothetical protein [Bifidobacterium sp. ESL0763]